MPKQKVIVTGDKATDKAIHRLGDPKLVRKIAVKVMRSELKPMLAAWRAGIPVRTGKLKKAPKIQSVRSRKGVRLDISILPKNLGGAPAGQAAAVEFGTEHQAPAAPARQAFDAGATSARDRVLTGMKAGILDAAKG